MNILIIILGLFCAFTALGLYVKMRMVLAERKYYDTLINAGLLLMCLGITVWTIYATLYLKF